VLADAGADPVHVAADLISQAEHDPEAASVLVTDSVALVDAVDAELERQVAATKHTERIRTALTGPQSGAVLVADLTDGLRVVDAYAAEHLEIQVAGRARAGAAGAQRGRGVRRAVVAGVAGRLLRRLQPRAAHRRLRAALRGLSVQTFLRGVHVVEYTEDALREVAGAVVTLAGAEDLPRTGRP
jgi:histidinol dehydrogenase